jgi:hypothetical protein
MYLMVDRRHRRQEGVRDKGYLSRAHSQSPPSFNYALPPFFYHLPIMISCEYIKG